MKSPAVKENKISSANSSKPFFNKSGEGTFFSQSKETNNPFFSAKPIQAKWTAGAINQNSNGDTNSNSGLPNQLKTGLEQLSGMDLSEVRVHKDSSKPSQINALAYAQGQNIHLGPGQEKHLPHESWHVVQQMQGRVKPTVQAKGVSINDNKDLEREADVMGAKALQMKNSDLAIDVNWQHKNQQNNMPIQCWTDLGVERWTIPGFGGRNSRLWTGTKEEWLSVLNNMDSDEEYKERLEGFLTVSNDPSIVHRTRAPRYIGDVPYTNTLTRAPNNSEKLEFLRALYEIGGDLDLWHGGIAEGGPYTAWADRALATFINNNQNMLIADISSQGRVISSESIGAIAEQGGSRVTMSMIINAGATAHKGVDLIMTANRQEGQAHESAHAVAMETVRNSGRVIREALKAHDARVAFRQQVVGVVFDSVWGIIPGGGTLTEAAKGILKAGLTEGLNQSQAEDGPRNQAEKINDEFVATCNALVYGGHITSGDVQDAINGFEAVRR